VGHASVVLLSNAEFRVRKAGQRRVRTENKKNVHAFIVGMFCSHNKLSPRVVSKMERVFYNPYKDDTFVNKQG
jgi:hypothetical protein